MVPVPSSLRGCRRCGCGSSPRSMPASAGSRGLAAQRDDRPRLSWLGVPVRPRGFREAIAGRSLTKIGSWPRRGSPMRRSRERHLRRRASRSRLSTPVRLVPYGPARVRADPADRRDRVVQGSAALAAAGPARRARRRSGPPTGPPRPTGCASATRWTSRRVEAFEPNRLCGFTPR